VCGDSTDELALVMGHEVSHLICDHTRQRSELKAMIAGVELALLSLIDPVVRSHITIFHSHLFPLHKPRSFLLLSLQGILSFFSIALMSRMNDYMSSRFSRQHESEADLMGIEIAAKACYNTQRACNIMLKFKEQMVTVINFFFF
jgi:Zn-dependent protease with chaperone function